MPQRKKSKRRVASLKRREPTRKASSFSRRLRVRNSQKRLEAESPLLEGFADGRKLTEIDAVFMYPFCREEGRLARTALCQRRVTVFS